MVVRDVIGVAVAIVVLAGLAVALQPRSQIVGIIDASAKGFSSVIRAATLQ